MDDALGGGEGGEGGGGSASTISRFISAAEAGDVETLEVLAHRCGVDVNCRHAETGDGILHACVRASRESQQDIICFALGCSFF